MTQRSKTASILDDAIAYFLQGKRDKHSGLGAVFSETYQRTGEGEDKYIACSQLMLDAEYSVQNDDEIDPDLRIDLEEALRNIIGDDPNYSEKDKTAAVTAGKTATVSETLVKKLNPARFSDMSGKMAAIVGYILDARYTDPYITEMAITSDGMVLAQRSGDVGMNDFLGSEYDLHQNWVRLMHAAGLEPEERKEAEKLFASKIRSHKQGSKEAAEMIHSDADLGQKMEPIENAYGQAHIDGPEAGPSNDELHSNSHEEAGVPVTDGGIKSPERQNVNAIREAIETQAEMEVGKPIEVKQQQVEQAVENAEAKLNSGATEVSAKPGTQIIINVGSKKRGSNEGGAWSISGVTPNQETNEDVNKALKRMKAAQYADWCDNCINKVHPEIMMSSAPGHGQVGKCERCGNNAELRTVKVSELKRSAEGIGGENQPGATAGHAGGSFGGTDLEGPSFHVGYTFRGKARENKFSSIEEAHAFIKSASVRFSKVAGDWTMKCPLCQGVATKDRREDSYRCSCGWSSNSAVASQKTARQKQASDPAKQRAQMALILTLLKQKPMTTAEVEKALGGGQYTNEAYPLLKELAAEGMVTHKQMRWSLKQAAGKTAAWVEWRKYIDSPVQVVTQQGEEIFPNLKSAQQKYPMIDPEHNGQDFTWAMHGVVNGKPAIRFEDWGTYKILSASKKATFDKKALSIETRIGAAGGTDVLQTIIDKLNAEFKAIKQKNPQGYMDSFEQQLPSRMMDIAEDMNLTVDYMPESDTYVFMDQVGKGTRGKKLEDFEQEKPAMAALKSATIRITSMKAVPQKGSPEWHQLQIAIQTMKMPDPMVGVAGGPDKAESERILAQYGLKWDDADYMAGGKGVKKAGDGMAKTEEQVEKEAGFNFFFPGQVLKEFYPEIQHEIVDYPNATNTPMNMGTPEMGGNPEIVGETEDGDLAGILDDALDTSVVEMIQLPADVSDPLAISAADYSSTSPAGGMGIGRDGKPEVLEGAPLRKENDIRGMMFTDEFYGQYEGIPGAAMAIASKTAAEGGEKAQFAQFLKKVCGEIAATLVAAFKVTSRPLLDKVPGVGEIQLDTIEQGSSALMPLGQLTQGGRVQYLLDKLNDGDIKQAINDAWAQAAVWNDSPDGGFVYEVFVRPETIDTDSLKMKYKFVCGTRE